MPGGGAGGHYDPVGSNVHGTPWGDGHLGDLPPLPHSRQPALAAHTLDRDAQQWSCGGWTEQM
jgi:Cu/Zn superoxide dismutase